MPSTIAWCHLSSEIQSIYLHRTTSEWSSLILDKWPTAIQIKYTFDLTNYRDDFTSSKYSKIFLMSTNIWRLKKMASNMRSIRHWRCFVCLINNFFPTNNDHNFWQAKKSSSKVRRQQPERTIVKRKPLQIFGHFWPLLKWALVLRQLGQ